ncbi:MAG: DNA primase, partial [Candidatus Cloacimonetes bacterium]|nr:DNA primase [Candidatus Cloacimonadota bacterium]
MIDQTVIERIRENVNIVDVINSYIPLKKTGQNYKALCPFHKEKTPSFTVSETKQLYKCFGCGKSGSVFNFIMEYEKVEFPEAVKKAGEFAGIHVDDGTKHSRTKSDLLYTAYTLAMDHFRGNLEKFGGHVWEYINERHISAETVKAFELGYAQDSFNALSTYLLKNQINQGIFEKTGLFGKNNSGFYDLFRERLMFPIRSSRGKVVAFGGRVLHSDQPGGKYINSPTTEIYTKGNELYGLHVSRYDINKADKAYIVEGYTDALRMYDSGFTQVVASLGTALTEEQVRKLSRFSQNMFVLYDADKAGLKAAARAAQNILAMGSTPRIVRLPDGEDPDSLILNEGKEAMQAYLDKAVTFEEFIYTETDLEISERQRLDMIVETIGRIEDPISQELFTKKASERFSVTSRALKSKQRQVRKSKVSQTSLPEAKKSGLAREIMKLIINSPETLEKICSEIDSDYHILDEYCNLYKSIINDRFGWSNISSYMEKVESEIERNQLADLLIDDSDCFQAELVFNE